MADVIRYLVADVYDGVTFMVDRPWEWNGQRGIYVRAYGVEPPPLTEPRGQLAKSYLTLLILGCQIELGAVHGVKNHSLICDVYFQGQPLSMHLASLSRPALKRVL